MVVTATAQRALRLRARHVPDRANPARRLTECALMASQSTCPSSASRTRMNSPSLPVSRRRLRVARSALPPDSAAPQPRRCCRTRRLVVKTSSRTCSVAVRPKPRRQLRLLCQSTPLPLRLRRRPLRPSQPSCLSRLLRSRRARLRPRRRSPSPLKNGSRAHDAVGRLLLFNSQTDCSLSRCPALAVPDHPCFYPYLPPVSLSLLLLVCSSPPD